MRQCQEGLKHLIIRMLHDNYVMVQNFDPIHQTQGIDAMDKILLLSQIIRDPVYIACSADTMKINEIHNVQVYSHVITITHNSIHYLISVCSVAKYTFSLLHVLISKQYKISHMHYACSRYSRTDKVINYHQQQLHHIHCTCTGWATQYCHD